MSWGFFQGGSFGCREIGLAGKMLAQETVGYFAVISLVFKEVVVVSVSQSMGLQASVWECPVLHLSTLSAGVAGSVTAVRVMGEFPFCR